MNREPMSAATPLNKVLVVDDDAELRAMLEELLLVKGWQVRSTPRCRAWGYRGSSDDPSRCARHRGHHGERHRGCHTAKRALALGAFD